jgi:hypothetical protein
MSCCCRCAAFVALLAAARLTGAQVSNTPITSSTTDCPIVGGVHVSVTARDSGRAAPRELVRVDRTTAVDTTFTFNVAERRWSFASLAASAAAGVADTLRGRWYLCAGAGVGLVRPRLVIQGARGQVRLRASLAELTAALARSQPRGGSRTPPRRT